MSDDHEEGDDEGDRTRDEKSSDVDGEENRTVEGASGEDIEMSDCSL